MNDKLVERPKLNIEEYDESRTLVWDDEMRALLEYVTQLELEIKRLRKRIQFVIDILPNEETETIMVLMATLEAGLSVASRNESSKGTDAE